MGIFAPEENSFSRIIHLQRGTGRLEALGEIRTFERNKILIRQWEKPWYCYVVKSGKVAACDFTVNGEERVYHVHEKDSVILEESLLFGWESRVELKVIRKAELVCITRAALMQAIQADPEVALDIIQSVSVKFMGAMDQLRHANQYGAEWRICELLLDYADYYGTEYDGKILIREKLSQQVMSNLLGINRITTVRAIKNLKEMGLLENINGFYCIRDRKLLRRHQERLE